MLFAALPGHLASGLTHLGRGLTHLGRWLARLARRLAQLGEIKLTPLQKLALLGGLAAASIFGALAFPANPIGQACVIAFVPGLCIAIGIFGTRWHTRQGLDQHLIRATHTAVHATLQLRRSVGYVDERLSAAQTHLESGGDEGALIEIVRAKTATELALGISEVDPPQWDSRRTGYALGEGRSHPVIPAATDGEFISGRVARVEDQYTVILNRGAVHGMQPEMVFAVLADGGDPILDPETGEVIGELPAEKLRVKVVDVQPKFSRAVTFPARVEYPATSGYSLSAAGDAGTSDFIDESLRRMLEKEFAEPDFARERIATAKSLAPQSSPVRPEVAIDIGDRVRQVRI